MLRSTRLWSCGAGRLGRCPNGSRWCSRRKGVRRVRRRTGTGQCGTDCRICRGSSCYRLGRGWLLCTASIDCRASIDLHQQEEHSREGRTKHHSYPRVGRSRRKACRGKGGRVGGACGQGIDGEGPAAQALCLGGLRIWPSRANGAPCAQLRGSGEHDGAARVRVRSVRASQRVGDDACGRRGRGRGTPQDVLCDEVLATRPLKHGGSGSRALITHVSRSSVHLSNLLTYLLYTYGTPDWRDLGFLVEAQISCVSTWLVVVSSTRG